MVRPIRLRGNEGLVSTVIGWNTMRGITLATAKRTVWLALPPVSGHGLSGELNFRGL